MSVFSICVFVFIIVQSTESAIFLSPELVLQLPPSPIRGGANVKASGSIEPNGPPKIPPTRVEAGESCIVDLTQAYSVTGTLSGSFEINFRIIVHGPCSEPPGTYDEEWIAYGTFIGTVNNTETEGKFTYTAEVRESGNIDGKIIFGQGITGELNIEGNFKDGKLSYKGIIN